MEITEANTVELSPWQSSVWDRPERFKVINAGRRTGKSTLCVLKMIDYGVRNPKSIIWYIAPTYRQAKNIMWQMLWDYIPTAAIAKTNETELRFELKNGTQIHLKGADNPDSLRGVRIDLAIFDEVAFFEKWDEAWSIMRPTLADSKADAYFISTPNGFNHFKDMADNQRATGEMLFDPKDYAYFHFTTYDNPFIDPKEVDQIKAEMTPDSFAQEMLGEFRKMEGLIYKDFSRSAHMRDIPVFDGNWTFTRSLDFGFAHKTALVYFAISPDAKTIYAYDGLYAEGLTTYDIAQAIRIKDAGRVITNPVADSAQPMMIEELAQEGILFNPVKKGRDSVKQGINKVAELLKIRKDTGLPTLMFNKTLTWIADEAERYRWMENKTDGHIKEAPLKRDDDAMDAIRYFAMNYQEPQDMSYIRERRNRSRKKWWQIG